MKGKVSSQRFLYREFERNDKWLAVVRVRYDELLRHWFIKNTDVNIPFEAELEMLGLGALLHHYFPDAYPPAGKLAHDNSDDDDG
jgi:hypothetical protein